MAQAYARKQLKINPETPLILKIGGIQFSPIIKNEEDICEKVLKRFIPNIKYSQIILKREKNKNPLVFLETNDISSVIQVLDLHLKRFQLSRLETWLVGFPDYLELQNQDPSQSIKELGFLVSSFESLKLSK